MSTRPDATVTFNRSILRDAIRDDHMQLELRFDGIDPVYRIFADAGEITVGDAEPQSFDITQAHAMNCDDISVTVVIQVENGELCNSYIVVVVFRDDETVTIDHSSVFGDTVTFRFQLDPETGALALSAPAGE